MVREHMKKVRSLAGIQTAYIGAQNAPANSVGYCGGFFFIRVTICATQGPAGSVTSIVGGAHSLQIVGTCDLCLTDQLYARVLNRIRRK